jgi:hypothetical protein
MTSTRVNSVEKLLLPNLTNNKDTIWRGCAVDCWLRSSPAFACLKIGTAMQECRTFWIVFAQKCRSRQPDHSEDIKTSLSLWLKKAPACAPRALDSPALQTVIH